MGIHYVYLMDISESYAILISEARLNCKGSLFHPWDFRPPIFYLVDLVRDGLGSKETPTNNAREQAGIVIKGNTVYSTEMNGTQFLESVRDRA